MHSFARQAGPQVFAYDRDKLSGLLVSIIQKNGSADMFDWLNRQAAQAQNRTAFNAAFSMMPRKTGKHLVSVSIEEEQSLDALFPHFTINGWTIDRLCRVWLLLQMDISDPEEYKSRIENLFGAADMAELVALYAALPLLAYGEMWKLRCAEGIRSNIGDVLQAIICNNPYPAIYLEQSAWNQMVLKAFFTKKEVHQIVGLDDRNNPELASTLIDYAHERYAAHRPVNPLLWRCVAPYINEDNFADIAKLLHEGTEIEKEAGALACWNSNYAPAAALLEQFPHLKQQIEKGTLNWQSIASSSWE